MVMQYHWGLAIGHLYTHGDVRLANNSNLPTMDSNTAPGRPPPDAEIVDATAGTSAINLPGGDSHSNSHDADEEFLLGYHEDDGWEDMEDSDDENIVKDLDVSDDEALMMDMYPDL